jgi:glycosyltransferase involved in cell wall biosynthesis
MLKKNTDRYCDVTVVMPCFNDGNYIIKALNSILNQSLNVKEIIIIDDGSDNETKDILKTISIDNVKIIHKKNEGVSKARNLAISMSKTEYILCLDSDDYFELTFVEKAVDILKKKPEIGIVGCFYRAFRNDKSKIIQTKGGDVKDFLIKNCGLGNSMFRKECWVNAGGYDESMLNGYEDWEFSISILKNNWQMHIIKEVLFNYRLKTISRDVNALKNYDFELRKYILSKHRQLYLNNFDFYSVNLLKENCDLRKSNIRISNSLVFKLGSIILKPLKLIRSFFRLK